ncbi:MAG TPA: glycosyltransferase family 2 protein [Bacteroidia bacterium]|jgi:GT2 family glycosyltransferase|nr:glycosyltransferase family 2 protein [Bacteroidia bacterium]
MQNLNVAVVILNYNGKKLLQKFLPPVIQHSLQAVIYVADNASTDDSISFLKTEFPAVKLIELKENYGFAKGYNEALKHVDADYFVLLNSDVEVTPNWIEPIITLMVDDKTIAAAQPKVLAYNTKDEFEYAGACGGFIDKYGYPFCRGRIFNTLEKDNHQYNEPIEVFWATGACMFIRADVFNNLKGFDDFYFAHMEEIDLCWRIKNTQHKIMAVPTSVVYHLGGGTLNKLSPRKTFLNFRNSLISLTKNNTSGSLILKIITRLVLDGVAGTKFLLEVKPAHTWAIIRAHFSFYASLKNTLRLRKEIKSTVNYKPSKNQIYQSSIVFDYFLKKKARFSDLKKELFTA